MILLEISGTCQADKDKRQKQRNDNDGDFPFAPMPVGLGHGERELNLAAPWRDARDKFLGRQRLAGWWSFWRHRKFVTFRSKL